MRLLLSLLSFALPIFSAVAADGNRLTYLDDDSPFWPTADSAKLATPQWVGEKGVDAVVIMAIDDMKESAKYEAYLRPILERLKKIDGRAPVSIMTNTIATDDPQLQTWLKEGVSLEVHTLTHPCPCLGKGSFGEAQRTYHGGVDLLATVAGNKPVAFRMPCCDSMNSASPRFFAEIFNQVSEKKNWLKADSSVFVRASDKRFGKYFPAELKPPQKIAMKDYAGYVDDYPYPYVVGKLCWEFPCMVPSDWEAFNVLGAKSATMLEDWKAALDWTVEKQGTMTTVLHPHGWSAPEQWVEFIDYAEKKFGKRVKFLTFPEAVERLEINVLAGWPLRNPKNGQDNGVRLLDVDGDGYMDALTSRGDDDITRLWRPKEGRWHEVETPFSMALPKGDAEQVDMGGRFGIIRRDGEPTFMITADSITDWTWTGNEWSPKGSYMRGLVGVLKLPPHGTDSGVRLRDFDADGVCEVLANRDVYEWSVADQKWKLAYALPERCAVVDEKGQDNGLRFYDLNGDGFSDVIQSNEQGYEVHLWAANVRNDLGWKRGWPHKVMSGKRKEPWSAEKTPEEIPPFVREGKNNGVWSHHRRLVVQNEDTVKLEAHTWIRDFKELIAFPVPPQKTPEESLKCFVPRPGFTVELVAAEPMIESPVAFEWDARGRLWVVEMRDYPLGMDGKGKPGGRIKVLTDEDGDGRYDKAVTFAEDLAFPTGVFPIWEAGSPHGYGVIVSAAPDILVLGDEDGDGRAERRRAMFTGFKPGNQQHRMNGFEWGLDGWLYGGNGDSGGKIVSQIADTNGREPKEVNISGRDFRFNQKGAFEAESGQVQFGRRRDDWGNWFGNNNSTWLWHYTLEDRYLRRNPKLAVKSVKQALANYEGGQKVYPAYPLDASPTRMNQPQSLGYTTSACSPSPYRDDLFGPDFATSVFISEPMYNVVHREVLEPNGATFTSRRADDEKDREFLASTDQWFRPTMVKTGPDGALYVADMYRFVLEHPEWIAPETQSRVDLRGGADKGRIYRIFPSDKKPRAIPNLGKLGYRELAEAMDSPNGWQRDTVQRMITNAWIHRDRTHDYQSWGPTLRKMVVDAKDAKVRVQALATLSSDGLMDEQLVRTALRDLHPQVRVHALRGAELKVGFIERAKLLGLILSCERDAELAVRRQLAFTLGEFRIGETDGEALAALTRMAEREGNNEQMRVAILSSLKPEDALFAKLNGAPVVAVKAAAMNLPPGSPDRAKVIAGYAKVDGMKGDAARGQAIFKAQCALCHRLKGDGNEVGPDLGMTADKPDDWMLAAIFDPNAAIEARYQAMQLKLKAGGELMGIVAAETANNLTLRLPGGAEQAVLRSEISAEKPLGKSLMPEGLEGALDAQAVADLLAWVRGK